MNLGPMYMPQEYVEPTALGEDTLNHLRREGSMVQIPLEKARAHIFSHGTQYAQCSLIWSIDKPFKGEVGLS